MNQESILKRHKYWATRILVWRRKGLITDEQKRGHMRDLRAMTQAGLNQLNRWGLV